MAVKLIDELQKEIKAASEAVTQEAYEKAYDHVFQILDNLEKLLNDNRYLEGNEITEEDKRLYDILIRFDAVYYFKQRLKRSVSDPGIQAQYIFQGFCSIRRSYTCTGGLLGECILRHRCTGDGLGYHLESADRKRSTK